MPLYEYQCPNCGSNFEELVQRGSTEPVVCPSCGETKPQRKLSAFACGGDPYGGSATASSCGSRGGFS